MGNGRYLHQASRPLQTSDQCATSLALHLQAAPCFSTACGRTNLSHLHDSVHHFTRRLVRLARHVLAGNKRTVVAEEERVVAQRDERGERRERREQRRAAVAQRAATIEPTTTTTGGRKRKVDGGVSVNVNEDDDSEVEFGGAGGRGVGGLGDRTGVG